MIFETDSSNSQFDVVVTSDFHGNSIALRAFIDEIRRRDIKNVLVLGDLLTYGCDPNGVVELLDSLQQECRCLFVKGNHDQFYFDLLDGQDPFSYGMHPFVRESVMWTYEQLESDIRTKFDWLDDYSYSGCYFAHANPFGYGDWRYINDASDHRNAADALAGLNYKIAFFGHTHRQKVAVCSTTSNDDAGVVFQPDLSKFTCDLTQESNISIFNTGSVGQPRGCQPSFLLVSLSQQHVDIEIIEIDFDIGDHLRQIQRSNMSKTTVDRLCSFFC